MTAYKRGRERLPLPSSFIYAACNRPLYVLFYALFPGRAVGAGRRLVPVDAFFLRRPVGSPDFYAAGCRIFDNCRFNGVFDAADPIFIGGGGKHDGQALRAGPAGAADTVHIIIDVVRHVVIIDMRNSFNINASGGDIGSDEDLCLGSGEVADNLIASALGHISLQLGRIEAAGDQFPGQSFRALFRIAENDGQVGIVFLQHGTEAIRLFSSLVM